MRMTQIRTYFVKPTDTPLADQDPRLIESIRAELQSRSDFLDWPRPDGADFLVLNETSEFKEWRYIKQLINDPLIGRYPHKTLTIHTGDSGAGLLPGLYTCLNSKQFSPALHRAVPYPQLANPLVENSPPHFDDPKTYLASWRGNGKSNLRLRSRMVRLFATNPRFCIEETNSWFDHGQHEHQRYVELIQNSGFSLCPAGWAPTTFRIYDSMALGVCPVILADSWVPPAGPKWDEFCIFIRQKSISSLEYILKRHEHEASARGRRAYEAWSSFFAGPKVIAYFGESLISLMRTLPESTPRKEIDRWNSYKMYRANGWTLSQRAVRRLRRVTAR